MSHTVNAWDGEEFLLTFSLQLRRDAIAQEYYSIVDCKIGLFGLFTLVN